MKKIFALLMIFILAFSITGCSKNDSKTVFEAIRVSPVAKLELPNGSFVYVDGEIAIIRTFADLELMVSPLEPADNENDWLYRIVFNPPERVKNANEIIVSFHEEYVQIDSEYYLAAKGVDFKSVLQWAESKFNYFLNEQ